MKIIIKFITVCLLTIQSLNAQNNLINAEVSPYKIELTQNKTTHILFPSSIVYVDLGSNEIMASKVESARNVLRVKTVQQDIKSTNFTVITTNGQYYNFNADYKTEPACLSYDLTKLENHNEKTKSEVLLNDLGGSSSSLTNLIMSAIIKNDKKDLNISHKSYKIKTLLKSISTKDGKLYIHISLENNSNLPYEVDDITFKIKDRRTSKRTTIQETEILPIKSHKDFTKIESQMSQDNVFMLDQFTLTSKQILLIETQEKNGIRNQVLKVKSSDILRVKKLF